MKENRFHTQFHARLRHWVFLHIESFTLVFTRSFTHVFTASFESSLLSVFGRSCGESLGWNQERFLGRRPWSFWEGLWDDICNSWILKRIQKTISCQKCRITQFFQKKFCSWFIRGFFQVSLFFELSSFTRWFYEVVVLIRTYQTIWLGLDTVGI